MTTKTTFRTDPGPLPMRSKTRLPRGCSFETYLANTVAMRERVAAWEERLEAAADAIRAALPATEGQLTWGLREEHSADDVCTALGRMIGDRVGAETSGEIVIVGYSGGGEVYGLR
jgi:hypothetical protein